MVRTGQVMLRGLVLVAAIAGIAMALLATRVAHAAEPRHDLDRVDAYAQSLFERSGLPGMALAIVEGDALVYIRGFGSADDTARAVGPDSLFIIGSTTKSMTALAILQLADAGKLRLDDPVTQYLPSFLAGVPQARTITLRTLLNQMSGLSHEAGDQPIIDAGDTSPNAIRNWPLALHTDALNRAPGSSYEYSNANYVVLGAIIETVTGQTYRDYMRQHVFAPLAMNHTYASLADVPREAMTHGHKMFLGANVAAEVPYAPAFVPVGFVISSASDIAKYLAAQLPGSSAASHLGISPQSIEAWHTGVAAMDPAGKGHYAMGWAVDTFNGLPVVYHTGDTGVFASEFTLDLANRRAVVLLTNGSNWLTSPYVQEISSGIINMLAGRAPRDDAGIHTMTWVILAVVLALPVLMLLVLVMLWRAHRPRGIAGRVITAAVYAGAAAALLYFLPREFMGIPLTELVVSLPDMGAAALASGVAALGALLLAVRPERIA
jgi:CubicO group peptidase (beta-lactamase class C family)